MTLTKFAQVTAPGTLVTSVSAEGSVAVITLRGEADLCTLPLVMDVLARVIAASDGPVIVDLAHAEFIDTGTVRVLAAAQQYLNDHDRTLTLRSPSGLTARVLGLLGVAHLVEPDRITTT